ncbi:MAG: ABC transporter permease [Anaerolineae bacterium]|nr:ABC transporter permease [Gemmatimonadaceae bacterium]
MSSAFRGFVRKEVLHLLRDRQTLAILLLLPLIQMLLFGFAIRTEVDDINIAVVDPAPDPVTLELRNRLEASGLFRIRSVLVGTAGLKRLFEENSVRQAIVFESGFAAQLERGEPARAQIITDATDPNSGSAMQAYALAVIQSYEAELRAARGNGATGSVRILMQTRMRFNPSMRSENLFVPGLLAFVVTLVSALMTAISIAREKEMGTMEVLLVSPLRPWQIVAGKVVPYIALGFGTVVLLLAVARLVFDVPVRGNVALLLAECLLYTVTALSLGVLISTRATSQRTAMIAALAGLMLPTMPLSGFIFPIDSMPAPLRVLTNVVPARWFVIVVRGIMVKGAGLAQLWQETVIMICMTVALLGISARRLAIRLE